MAAEPILAAEDLRVRAGGRTLVEIPSFAVSTAETHVVMGPNGAGKSTLLRALNGLLHAKGTLRFDGRPVHSSKDRAELRRATASVFQKPYLLSTTVMGNVETGLRLRGVHGEERRRRAQAVLEMLHIEHLAGRRRDGLSGGEAQRVSIARALVLEPRVLFLDEPMAALDPPTRRSLLADLFAVFESRSISAVWVTHDREEAIAVGDRVTYISAGKVLQQGPAAEVFRRLNCPEVAEYLGLETYIEGTVVIEAETAYLQLDDGQRIMVGEADPGPGLGCIFPEEVLLLREPPASGSSSLRNLVGGQVTEISTVGRLRRVIVEHNSLRLTSIVTKAALDDLALRVGDPIVAGFKASAVHVLPRHHPHHS